MSVLTGSRLAQLALAAAAVLVIALHAPASAQTPTIPKAAPIKADALATEDPFEPLNRWFFGIHWFIDKVALKPLALGYEHAAPRPLQRALHNLVTEFSEPMVFANDMVQLRPARAVKTAARFVANATIGVAGLLDPATGMGLPHHANGFGATLGRYGIQPGPYMFLPLFGPSDFRDLIGLGVDFITDPVGWGHYDGDAVVRGGTWILGGLDQRVLAEMDIEQIQQMGADTYATMRSLYLQDRQSEIRGGAPVQIEDLPSLDEGPAPATSAPPAPTPGATAPAASAADPAASAPASAAVATASPESGPDAAWFLTPPEDRPAPPAGTPIEL